MRRVIGIILVAALAEDSEILPLVEITPDSDMVTWDEDGEVEVVWTVPTEEFLAMLESGSDLSTAP